jgi:4-hydroxy-tetrahydrodipicolinate reductase
LALPTLSGSVTSVCVSGALGNVGCRLIQGIWASPDFELHSAVARREAGRDIGEIVLGKPIGVEIDDRLESALGRGPDVLVDYTHPSVVRRNVALALERGIPVVIGTTGLFDSDFEEIDAAARAANVGVATGNFSLTAALLQHLARIAARHVPQWEVIEYAKAEKPDVPSGTARELAELLARERLPARAPADDELIGPPEARGAEIGGARVHSIRLPGSSPCVEVIFGLPGERLLIRHDEQADSGIFVQGSLLAAQRVRQLNGLVRGLDSLLFAT